jgi:hypothetical protein
MRIYCDTNCLPRPHGQWLEIRLHPLKVCMPSTLLKALEGGWPDAGLKPQRKRARYTIHASSRALAIGELPGVSVKLGYSPESRAELAPNMAPNQK